MLRDRGFSVGGAFALACSLACGQPLLTIPPDPFPTQDFFDSNPGAVLFIKDFRDGFGIFSGMTIDYNSATVNVLGVFWPDDSTVHQNATFVVSGEMGIETFGVRLLNSNINMQSGSISEVTAHGQSIIEMSGGRFVEDIRLFDQSYFIMNGGRFEPDTYTTFMNASGMTVNSGDIYTGFLEGFDESRLEINGGTVRLWADRVIGFSEVVIRGGRWFFSDSSFFQFDVGIAHLEGSCIAPGGVRLAAPVGQVVNFTPGSSLDTPVSVVLNDRNSVVIKFIGDYIVSFLPTASPCLPDFDCNADLNFFDFSIFLNLYKQFDSRADLNGDGLFNFFDVSVFLSAYKEGCDL